MDRIGLAAAVRLSARVEREADGADRRVPLAENEGVWAGRHDRRRLQPVAQAGRDLVHVSVVVVDEAADLLQCAVDHRQPKTGALAGFLGGEERLENTRLRFSRHAVSVVSDPQDDVCAWRHWRVGARRRFVESLQRGRQHQVAAARHRIAGVDREIDHRLFDLPGIAQNRWQVCSEFGPNLDVGAKQPREQPPQGADRVVQIEEPWFQQFLAAEGEELPRYRPGTLRGAANFFDVGARDMVRRNFRRAPAPSSRRWRSARC